METITLLLFLLLISLPHSKPDLSPDHSALLSLRSAVRGRTLLWNSSLPSPCSWTGVQCEQNRVTVLRLPGFALTGEIPLGVFSNLTQLRTLSLRLNALTGNLPQDLANYLVRLNLAENNFTGEISPGFNNFTRLGTLFLEDNSLSGSLPDLKLQKLKQFNVSNNLLNGSITGIFKGFGPSSFGGTSLCGKPLPDCKASRGAIVVPSIPNGGVEGKRKKLSGGAIAGIVIGSIVGLLLIVLILMFLRRKKSSSKSRSIDIASIKQEMEIQGDKPIVDAENGGGYGSGYSVAAAAAAAMVGSGKGGDLNSAGAKKLVFFGKAPRVFDLEDLLRASAEVLGKGSFGTAYKAVLEMGTVVAVKRLRDVTISEREFREKIETVGAMDHENLVPLRAYYYSRDEKLLVYDYMSMGSLSALLHGNKGGGRTPLDWKIRSGIALATARGIEYLHSQGPSVSHGNIKSSNILLTQSYNARVSDFGLAHLVGPTSTPNRVAGYRAPEPRPFERGGRGPSAMGSVYCSRGMDFRGVDAELLRYQNVEEEMVQLLQLGVDCAAQYPDNRPSMSDVTRRIEELCRVGLLEDHAPQPEPSTDADDNSSR
ncbi:INACTIVE RECEPTOR KINASE-RELATED [Salix viminalis]|uniref:INACTIVE RECEPTOR KINASE-RELATED n=1 Tax=Salix viminalis TaxID=40686 RepID=A0A9Q0SHM5_SALVM|nr:INACTIVE RECEPTOR KINASE-RELATED [Salix viminalis]